MQQLAYAALWMMTWAVALAACGDDGGEPDASTAAARDGSLADASATCTLPSDCQDYEFLDMTTTACCSSTEACGYELPPLDDFTKMDYPEAEVLYAELTSGDPNGRCAPESFFFGTAPVLPEQRIPVEGGEDILLSPDCTAFHVLAWGLTGCCLPDDSCGLSTDASWSIFANIVQSEDSPFNRAECLTAEALNQQFRDSVVLDAFARTAAGGSCDYAALSARLEPAPDSEL